ncbi:hypothetical protein OO013_16555 [Mangrovivirga sp. M17]|uniref:Uncharacterized protein n=1 Tax=Mangrovivirga halotolerans TaxID=2993936 RepID=A0ABT3RUN6_9BACT|nr:hypothetical protein [Mangrovivirga halotolerans]MCX2745493.1 hypothetical protein [Mangrovivirga halotolerans]
MTRKNFLLHLCLTLTIILEIITYFEFYGGDIFFNLEYTFKNVIFLVVTITTFWNHSKLNILIVVAYQLVKGLIMTSYDTTDILFNVIMISHFVLAPGIFFHKELANLKLQRKEQK